MSIQAWPERAEPAEDAEDAEDAENAEDAEHTTQTRERILSATAKVLSELGYAGTRLADIATTTGIQAPAIYHYFASREELIETVMVTGVVRKHRNVQHRLAELPADASPMDRVGAALRAHLEALFDPSSFTNAGVRIAAQVPPESRARQLEAEGDYGALWHTLLVDAYEAGAIQPDIDLVTARMFILGALDWTVEWWRPDAGPLDPLVATVQSIVRNGLR